MQPRSVGYGFRGQPQEGVRVHQACQTGRSYIQGTPLSADLTDIKDMNSLLYACMSGVLLAVVVYLCLAVQDRRCKHKFPSTCASNTGLDALLYGSKRALVYFPDIGARYSGSPVTTGFAQV